MTTTTVLAFVALFGVAIAASAAREDNGIHSRIIGGYPAPDGQFHYQASLRDNSGKHLCGAAIINNNYLLTTCRCVNGKPDLSVIVGSKFLDQGGEKHILSRAICHENFQEVDLPRNDIALLKVAKPIIFNDKVEAIPLEENDIGDGTETVVSGWGATSQSDGTLADKLRFARLYTITNAECQERLFPNGVAYNQLCTFAEHSIGLCDGDVGGPLVAQDKLVGIASWGKNCADGFPDVFTKVSSYLQWIKVNMNEN